MPLYGLLGHAVLPGQLGNRDAALVGLEDAENLLFGRSVTLDREISCYQAKRSGKLTLVVDRFLGERSKPRTESPLPHQLTPMLDSAHDFPNDDFIFKNLEVLNVLCH